MSFIKRPNINTCPGIDDFIRPNVDYEECQTCGRVEFWSDEETGQCIDCGANFEKLDPAPSCLEYCDYVDTCKGIIMSRRNMKRI